MKVKIICIKDSLVYTKGKEYEAIYNLDPEGWVIVDDLGNRELFFDLTQMFEIV